MASMIFAASFYNVDKKRSVHTPSSCPTPSYIVEPRYDRHKATKFQEQAATDFYCTSKTEQIPKWNWPWTQVNIGEPLGRAGNGSEHQFPTKWPLKKTKWFLTKWMAPTQPSFQTVFWDCYMIVILCVNHLFFALTIWQRAGRPL